MSFISGLEDGTEVPALDPMGQGSRCHMINKSIMESWERWERDGKDGELGEMERWERKTRGT